MGSTAVDASLFRPKKDAKAFNATETLRFREKLFHRDTNQPNIARLWALNRGQVYSASEIVGEGNAQLAKVLV